MLHYKINAPPPINAIYDKSIDRNLERIIMKILYCDLCTYFQLLFINKKKKKYILSKNLEKIIIFCLACHTIVCLYCCDDIL
jgi:hypothetical protein